jgi:ribonuclease R
MTDREVLRIVERSPGQRAGYKQLVRELSLPGGRERRLLVEHLARLTAAGRLVKLDRDHWAMPNAVATRENLVAGRLDLHREGYGFVRPDTRQAGARVGEDIFIPPHEINSAMQGDQVLVELLPSRGDGRKLGRIGRVLTRKNPTVVGIFHYSVSRHSRRDAGWSEARFTENTVTPFDDRITAPIIIPDGMELPANPPKANPNRVLGEEAAASHVVDPGNLEGIVVDIEITDFPAANRPARGRVIEILGPPEAFGVDVEITIRKHHLPHVFPSAVLAEAREVVHLDPETIAPRRDFRSLPIVTIDGETAKDFDDAVLVTGSADGTYQLQVHIADVAEYVCSGTDLDLEARLRGNSVYFPDRAVPMLPQELSTGICSLRPGEDRLVLSCLMQIDGNGEVLDFEICEGVIRSARRMTYTQVAAILDPGRDDHETMRARFADLVPAFERMKELAVLLNRKRQRRGSIDFDLPEPIIEFDSAGAMQNIVRSTRSWANRLVEEFMLAANECIAVWIEHQDVPSIYRIHEMPEAKRVIEFEETAAAFGYSLGIGALPVKRIQMKSDRREQQRHQDRGRGARDQRANRAHQHEIAQEIPVTPQMYQRLTAKIAGKPEERILAYLMLRSLKQARYSEKNEGHFALAAPSYTHFTSPIRRYPDLVIHRIVKALLAEGADPHGTLTLTKSHASGRTSAFEGLPGNTRSEAIVPIPESELAAIAQETSQTERRAAEAERELIEWKKIKFMRDRVGEDFDGMILNATRYGLFVELDNLFVEGLVPIDSLRDDHYTYRENTREIIGGRNRRKYFMGQRVRVVLDRIDSIQKRLQFSLIGEDINHDLPRKKKTQDKKKNKEKQVNPSEEGRGKANSGAAKVRRARKASGHAKQHKKKGKS